MTEAQEDELIKAATTLVAVYGAYRVAGLILNKIGIDPANTEIVNKAMLASPNNPFSLQSAPGMHVGANSWVNIKNRFDSGDVDLVNARAGAPVTVRQGEALYNAFSFFTGTDFNAINGVFAQMRTKEDVALLAQFMNDVYGVDLLTFLKNGIYHFGPLNWGLSDNQLAMIVNHVNSLPDK
jgi:hypothetical protein